jgi:hypothetical protein
MDEITPLPVHVCSLATSAVIDSRPAADGFSIRRRRQCVCGSRFTTYELFPGVQWNPRDQRRYVRAIRALQVALEAVRELSGRDQVVDEEV